MRTCIDCGQGFVVGRHNRSAKRCWKCQRAIIERDANESRLTPHQPDVAGSTDSKEQATPAALYRLAFPDAPPSNTNQEQDTMLVVQES